MTTALLPLSRQSSSRNSSQTMSVGQFYLNSADMLDSIPTITKFCLKNWIRYEFEQLGENYITVLFDESNAAKSLTEINSNMSNQLIVVDPRGSESPLLGADHNLMFRAIHDYHHYAAQCDFSLGGEMQAYKTAVNAFLYHAEMLGTLIDDGTKRQICSILYSEIYLQAAAYHELNEFPKTQKVVLTHAPYTGL